MTKTVVVLGAGMAGLPISHYLLSHTTTSVPDLRVILVNPSDEFYWNLASVRAVVPGQLSEDKYLWSIPKLFAKYPSDKFEFLAGKAETLSPDSNSVVVALNDGSKRSIDYHTVIIATGSDSKDGMPWKTVGTSQQTRAALAKLQQGIKDAKSIVVGGAGTTGVEFAGELGTVYAKAGTKAVTIISADTLPLESRVMESTRSTAKSELERLNVKFIAGAKITNVTEAGGQQVLELTKKDGSKTALKTDLFVPTFGMVLNTQFAPRDMLDAQGQLQQDKYLRAPKYKNVFVLGDAGNLEAKQAAMLENQIRHLAKQFDSYFKSGQVEEYKFDPSKVMLGISIGSGRGTGQVGTWKPFSLIMWFMKSRHLGTDKAMDIAAGLRTFGGKW
ncbi:hypothetical protein JX265_004002 [Neoarthrinium moseri]|uniref:FAD/NAD(P)-binding domain-containing protein n=1 Tax=Neoarthrinium moseri TaxID=1658444 RepID=A0A9P9WRF7_9PEZI|nr:hypothetical protein JX265_004002 [Neoarthrinium moseri]